MGRHTRLFQLSNVYDALFSGEFVKELTDPNRQPNSYVYDICVDGDTVIIPRDKEGVVLYYKLKYD